jgi:hypothetical protein
MGKKKPLIRRTYLPEVSIGILLLMFVIAFFLSHQIFEVRLHDLDEDNGVYFGMFLVTVALLNMVMIMWEDLLFPVRTKELEGGGATFRNHRTKLKVQILIYLTIPVIFTFIYFEYEVNHVRFFIWASICMLPPIVDKLISGINNYNDYLTLTEKIIEYKNNAKEGHFIVQDIQHMAIIKDERKVIQKIRLDFKDASSVTIDLDEMELDAFYHAIFKYILSHYEHLLK